MDKPSFFYYYSNGTFVMRPKGSWKNLTDKARDDLNTLIELILRNPKNFQEKK